MTAPTSAGGMLDYLLHATAHLNQTGRGFVDLSVLGAAFVILEHDSTPAERRAALLDAIDRHCATATERDA